MNNENKETPDDTMRKVIEEMSSKAAAELRSREARRHRTEANGLFALCVFSFHAFIGCVYGGAVAFGLFALVTGMFGCLSLAKVDRLEKEL